MALRDIDSYPPQEPFSEIGAKYNVEVQKLSAGIDGDAFAYGGDQGDPDRQRRRHRFDL